jgi:hypothetical protein
MRFRDHPVFYVSFLGGKTPALRRLCLPRRALAFCAQKGSWPSRKCCRDRMAIAGIFPGGRPLRRRRDMVLIYGRQGLRGTVALQASIIIVAKIG